MINATKLAEAPVVECFITKRNLQVTAMIVYQDESTDGCEVDSLSMRGAQREMTGYLKSEGLEPVGRWENETGNLGSDDIETSRKFRRMS